MWNSEISTEVFLLNRSRNTHDTKRVCVSLTVLSREEFMVVCLRFDMISLSTLCYIYMTSPGNIL